MINTKIVFNIIGVLICLLAGFMLIPVLFSISLNANDVHGLLESSLVTFIAGIIIWLFSRNAKKTIGKKEGYLIVALGWLSVSIASTLPYLFSGTIPDLTSAFFESVSGLTTTGATVLDDIEAVPYGILCWRSLTQWIGGMGIIVLTVALFPLLGIGGVELFVAEAPGPQSDKLHPRIKETAKRLWFIYLGLTFSLILILYIMGMSFFDAFNHGLTTMSTGGFSTKNTSIAYFDTPSIQYVILLFMFVAGCNYTLIYFLFKGNFKKVWHSDEFKAYLFFVSLIIIIVAASVYQLSPLTVEESFRHAAFQVVSLITTTGYITSDYTAWSPGITSLFFVLLFTGACAGSTSGGIKVIRHLVFIKNSFLEFKRLLHPNAVIRIKVDGKLVAPRILTHILVFLLIYLMIFVVSSIIMAFIFSGFENPILTALGATATALGNVGPALGDLGPVDNFSIVPAFGKWVLIVLMFLGRLELFTILVIFSPYFWRIN